MMNTDTPTRETEMNQMTPPFDPRVKLDESDYRRADYRSEQIYPWYVATNLLGTKFFTPDYAAAVEWVNN